jgi:hypothetical protein
VRVKERAFKSEADLCAAFIAWATKQEGVKCYAEWAGWDILVVYRDGFQLGIQAKLRLNAEVIGQASPHPYEAECESAGPDFRGVLVPEMNPLGGLALRLGLVVFHPYGYDAYHRVSRPARFTPGILDYADGRPAQWSGNARWVDWNPRTRHAVPETETGSIAGSPCPVTLTHWKLGALAVLAEIAVKGPITAKRIKALGVHPGRWTTNRWLEPAETRGEWVRGEKCPKFDEQHPAAYALALEKVTA